MADRRPLPARRQGYCFKLTWQEQSFFLHVNFYDEAKTEVGEVFADIGKTPTSIQQLVAASCILISVAIQCGVPLPELLKSQPRHDDEEHFTIVGMILQEIVNKGWEKENENSTAVADTTRGTSEKNDQQGRHSRVGKLGRLEGVTPSGSTPPIGRDD